LKPRGTDGYQNRGFLGKSSPVHFFWGVSELLARIRAALRRSSPDEPLSKLDTPELSVDFGMRLVTVRGKRVYLSPKEFEVLRILVQQEGKPLTHERLSKIVWGSGHAEKTENLPVLIMQLRKKIEKDPATLATSLPSPGLGTGFYVPAPHPLKAHRGLASRKFPQSG
jgi:two-component system KDP operon response regulator KdpE